MLLPLLFACGPAPTPPPPRPIDRLERLDPTGWRFADAQLQKQYLQLREEAASEWPGGGHRDLEVRHDNVTEVWCRAVPCDIGRDDSVTLEVEIAPSLRVEAVRGLLWRTARSERDLRMDLTWRIGDRDELSIAFMDTATGVAPLTLAHHRTFRVASGVVVPTEFGSDTEMARACAHDPESLVSFADRARDEVARTVRAALDGGDLTHLRRTGTAAFAEVPLTPDEVQQARSRLSAWVDTPRPLLRRASQLHALVREGLPETLLTER